MLSKMSDRERQMLYVFTYMWNLKNKITKEYKNTEIDSNTENKLVVTSGERVEEGKDR